MLIFFFFLLFGRIVIKGQGGSKADTKKKKLFFFSFPLHSSLYTHLINFFLFLLFSKTIQMTTSRIDGKGPIFVTNADGDKGYAIAQRMLQFPSKYPHLPRYPVYAGLPDASTTRATSLKEQGANLRAFDIFNDHKAAVDALRGVVKLCLVVDPLSERISRANAFQYAKA